MQIQYLTRTGYRNYELLILDMLLNALIYNFNTIKSIYFSLDLYLYSLLILLIMLKDIYFSIEICITFIRNCCQLQKSCVQLFDIENNCMYVYSMSNKININCILVSCLQEVIDYYTAQLYWKELLSIIVTFKDTCMIKTCDSFMYLSYNAFESLIALFLSFCHVYLIILTVPDGWFMKVTSYWHFCYMLLDTLKLISKHIFSEVYIKESLPRLIFLRIVPLIFVFVFVEFEYG